MIGRAVPGAPNLGSRQYKYEGSADDPDGVYGWSPTYTGKQAINSLRKHSTCSGFLSQ
jgi:hypothetical protein